MVVKQSFQEFNMSWAKESAQTGLAGLTPREAVRGVLTLAEFQQMPDPLDPFGHIVKEEDVSTQFCEIFYLELFPFVEHVEQRKVYCIKLYFRAVMNSVSQNCGFSWGRRWGWWS